MKKIIGLTFIFLVFLLAACSADTSSTPTSTTDFTPPAEITKSNTGLFSENGTDGVMYSKLINGTIVETQEATVLTDESCNMDKNGITSCFNNIRLENGEEIRVNTLHAMEKIPCLSKDEKVQISLYENDYVEIARKL